MNLDLLKVPFEPKYIGWYPIWTNQDGKIKATKAKFVPFVSARGVMDRLDSVVGATHWKNEFDSTPDNKGVLCGISILLHGGEWVTKWDGAENSKIEPVKGGLSGSFKRAGVQWGIGRYLYNYKAHTSDVDQWMKPAKPLVLPKDMLPQPNSIVVPAGKDLVEFAIILEQATKFVVGKELPEAGKTLAEVAVNGGAVSIMLIRYYAGDYESKEGYFTPDGEEENAMQAVAKDLLHYV